MPSSFDAIDLDALHQRRSYKWQAHGPDVLPAFLAESDFALAPPIARALHAAIDAGDTGYASSAGLAQAFAEFAAARHDWAVDPDRVFLVPDVMGGADQVLLLTTQPDDGVVINPPVYPPFYQHIEHIGRRVVEVPLAGDVDSGWRIDLAAVESAFAAGARAYLLCSPHNPTGIVHSPATLRRIAELADRYDVTVVSDEIHAPLTLAGATHTAYVSLGDDAACKAVTVASASKAFNLPGLKCAVIVAGSDSMRATLGGIPEEVPFGAGLLGVIGNIAAWREGGPWLDELLAHIDRNRQLVADLLREQLPGVRYRPPDAGYLAWVDCRDLGLGDDPYQQFLSRGRVALGRGLDFGAQGAGFVRITMATSAAILEDVVCRMAATVASVNR